MKDIFHGHDKDIEVLEVLEIVSVRLRMETYKLMAISKGENVYRQGPGRKTLVTTVLSGKMITRSRSQE